MSDAGRWPLPRVGDIVWCHFPEDLSPGPGPKPRPALVLAVGSIDDQPAVEVAFGTSQRTNRLYAGEFCIRPEDGDAYRAAGLSYATKFNLGKRIELPYTTTWFAVAPGAPFGRIPQLGLLHPSLMRRARSAWESIRR
ncbi:MAG: hypothetical protein EPO25_11970 [Gammaproteobacteria bacterium]|nr:MAG: hypothetical protein EPO25_11970 [Gammaproteobacteria bacterium]